MTATRSLASQAAVVGIGRTAYSRESGRTTLGMAAEACRAAIADAGLQPGDIDGIADFQAGDSHLGVAVAQAVGVDQLSFCLDIFGGGNQACAVVTNAAAAVQTGQAKTVLVYRSLNGRSGKRFGVATGDNTPMAVPGEGQFSAPQGYMTPPQWMAMWARRHQHIHGSSCEDLGQVAITQRRHAHDNPHAINRDLISMDDYLATRWVHEPLRLLDCTMEVDGAVAIVITTLDRARDLPHPPVRMHAAAESHGQGGSWDQWADPSVMFSHFAAPTLWERAGMGPADSDVACIYDCFTYTVMAVMEDFGFCDKGEVGDFFAGGRATYGGDVVVNPHGGLLSEGYIHGMNHHYEAVLQLRRAAGSRQVPDAANALVTAGAGPYGGAIIYTGELG